MLSMLSLQPSMPSMSSLPAVDWMSIIQLLIAFYVAKFYFKYFTRHTPLPGPFPLPLIGNLHQVRLNPPKYAVDHHKEFGNIFEIWVGSKRFIFLCHASLMEQVYTSSTTNKFFPRVNIGVPDVERGIVFNNDYQSWKVDRKFVSQSLMSPRFLRSFTHNAQSLFNENESFWDKKEYHIDFGKWIKCFTSDITLQTVTRKPSYNLYSYLFGEEHSDPAVREGIKISNRFLRAIQDSLMYIMLQTLLPSFITSYVPGVYHLSQKYKRNMKWFDETILDIVKKRRNEIEEMSSSKDIGSNLLDVLLTYNTPFDPNGYDENETPMTDLEVCRVIKDISAAGTDTTGNTFCFTLWQIIKHPEILARFQQEIKEILGDDITRKINYEDLDKFTYLDAIIKESTRIIPLTPVSSRYSTDYCEIGGKRLAPNTTVFIHHELIQNSSDCWKDPDQFIPERFLKGADKIVKNSFIPFGGGVRICPGRHMAMAELKTLFILLFRKYEIELVDKELTKSKIIKFMGLNTCEELKVILRPKKNISVSE